MPVTAQSLATTPYQVGAVNVPASAPPALPPAPPNAGPTKYRNVHTIYPAPLCRINLAMTPPTVQSALTVLAGARNVNGDAYYLKYFDDEVTSMRLPCPAPAGVAFFMTDNMSGCKFYVDRIAGSNDLIVYHVNTHQHTAGALADADVQTGAANGVLDGMHNAAQGDWAPLALHNVAQCAMPTYFGAGGQAERRKRLQGRQGALAGQNPKFLGGCTIVGFPAGNTWEFWYQTWGDVSYNRPTGAGVVAKAVFTGHWNYLRKRVTQGDTHRASFATMRVLDHRRVF